MNAQPRRPPEAHQGSSSGCLKAVVIIVVMVVIAVAALVGGGWFYFKSRTSYEPSFAVGPDQLWQVVEVPDEPLTVASVDDGNIEIRHVFPFHDLAWVSASGSGRSGIELLFDVETQKPVAEGQRPSTERSASPYRSLGGNRRINLKTGEVSQYGATFRHVPDGVWLFIRDGKETRYGFFDALPDIDDERRLELTRRVPLEISKSQYDFDWDAEEEALYYYTRTIGPCPVLRFQAGEAECLVQDEARFVARGQKGAIVQRLNEQYVWHAFDSDTAEVIAVDGCELDDPDPVVRGDGGIALVIKCPTEEPRVLRPTYIWTPEKGATEIDRELDFELTYRDLVTDTVIPTVVMEPGRQPVGLPPGAQKITRDFYFWKGGVYWLDLAKESLHRIAPWECPGVIQYPASGRGTNRSLVVASCEEWGFDEAGIQARQIASSIVIDPGEQRVFIFPNRITHVSENYFVGHPKSVGGNASTVVAFPRSDK